MHARCLRVCCVSVLATREREGRKLQQAATRVPTGSAPPPRAEPRDFQAWCSSHEAAYTKSLRRFLDIGFTLR